jgi:hypothetical protein
VKSTLFQMPRLGLLLPANRLRHVRFLPRLLILSLILLLAACGTEPASVPTPEPASQFELTSTQLEAIIRILERELEETRRRESAGLAASTPTATSVPTATPTPPVVSAVPTMLECRVTTAGRISRTSTVTVASGSAQHVEVTFTNPEADT